MNVGWVILPTLVIFNSVWSYDNDDDDSRTYSKCLFSPVFLVKSGVIFVGNNVLPDSCRQQESFNLADMDGVMSFTGKATCRQYQKIYQVHHSQPYSFEFNDPNFSSIPIRMLRRVTYLQCRNIQDALT